MELILNILSIVLVSYVIYFLYLKIKLNKEKIKYMGDKYDERIFNVFRT